MYSGTTITNLSGNLVGVHQKINRAAHKNLRKLSGLKSFPTLKQINHFEGKNGPDGTKTKGSYQDVVLHFYDPYDPNDTALTEHINEHFQKLVYQLKSQDVEKSSFEAAWLAHSIVDGLTPAHHYPYEAEMLKIRGDDTDQRDKFKSKIMASGDTRVETAKKNWLLWGAKGLITTHSLFELGVATILVPVKIKLKPISLADIEEAKRIGIEEVFVRSARRIAGEFAYDEFIRKGWSPALARWVRSDLTPEIVRVVTLSWHLALKEAGMASRP